MFIWFIYVTELQRAMPQSHRATLKIGVKVAQKIAGVTSVLRVWR